MANSTVYPYGTGGQLPSSIGIINDLKTGGADKALSAEQGKNVGIELYGTYDNYTRCKGMTYKGVVTDSNGYCLSGFIPAEKGDVVIYTYGTGRTGYSNTLLTLGEYDEDYNFLNYWTGNVSDQRTVTLTRDATKYIRASFYSRNDQGLISPRSFLTINGDLVFEPQNHDASDSVTGRLDELEGKSEVWKPLILGELINSDVENGDLDDDASYNDVRVTTKCLLVLPKAGIKIRFIGPDYWWCSMWHGNSAGGGMTLSGVSSSGLTLTAASKSYRVIFGKVNNSVENTSYKGQVITAQQVQDLIDSGDIRVEYQDSDPDVIVRNSGNINVWAAKRKRASTLADNSMDYLPTFVHVSDVHGDVARMDNAFKYADYIKADSLLNTGDAVMYYRKHGSSFNSFLANKYDTPLCFCIGNHEAFNTGSQTLFADNIQSLVTSEGYLASTGVAATNCYYYKDFDSKKIRVIVINYYDNGVYRGRLGSDQITWFISTLSSTPAGYGIIVILHSPEDGISTPSEYSTFRKEGRADGTGFYVGNRPISKLVDAFISRESVSFTYTDNVDASTTETVSVSADFTGVDSSIEFIAYACGHVHEDCIGYYKNATNLQLCLCITCGIAMYGDSNNAAWANQDDLPRGGDGISQDAMNVYAIDRDEGTVKVARVGASKSQKFTERDCMIIPYKAAEE